MKIKALVSVAFVSFLSVPAAQANEILTYRSPDFASGDYLTATVDLSCTVCTNATFTLPPDITSITVSAFSPTNVLLDTISAPSPNTSTFGIIDYITLSDLGEVTGWFFDLKSQSTELLMATTGDDRTFGTGNLYQNASGAQEFTDQAGTWSVAAAPGPMVGAGLPGLLFASAGLLAWLRQRRMA